MSEIAIGTRLGASAQGKLAISEHDQEHAPGVSPAVLDIRSLLPQANPDSILKLCVVGYSQVM
jgi:hypothetical protein